jgi:hypothetical protein
MIKLIEPKRSSRFLYSPAFTVFHPSDYFDGPAGLPVTGIFSGAGQPGG